MGKTLSLEVSTFLKVCESVDTPRALTCYILAKSQEWQQYFDLPPPRGGVEVDEFKGDYLVTEMLSKNADIDIGIDKKNVALEKFRKTEQKCHETNDRFAAIGGGRSPPPEFLRDMRYWINRILGNLSHEKLEYVEQHFRFGPGASSSCVGTGVTPANKYACDAHTTLRLRPYLRSLMGPVWCAFPFGEMYVNDSSRVTTVPKNAKTDRVICIEPHMNVYVQLGIGAVIRRQLKRFGVDLDTQEWNRHLASVSGSYRLATVDLSSASDMIAFNVVKYLLPKRWFELLYLARTDETLIGSEQVTLEKFSSMGNGFTFELESLIFTAAALAAGADRRLMAVYGDDIILERSCYPALSKILTFLGFEVNSKKTFVEGDFFESCGTDWYRGVNVRPVYLRGDYLDEDAASFMIANAIRRWATTQMSSHYWVSDARFLRPWLHVVQRASQRAKMTWIPDGFGDDGFVRNQNELCQHGLTARRLPCRPIRSKRTPPNGAYVLALHKGTPEISRMRENIRGTSVRVKKSVDDQLWHWSGVGPWV